MDSDILKALGNLEEKREKININTDLTKYCDKIEKLDRNVGKLLDRIRAIHVHIEKRFSFMENKWDRLGPAYKTLQRTSDALDLVIGLTKLNRICRRINTNPNLCHTDEGKLILRNSSAFNGAENDENIDENGLGPTELMVIELLDSFEITYSPFEDILSIRTDLPYSGYATKVRNLRQSLTRTIVVINKDL